MVLKYYKIFQMPIIVLYKLDIRFNSFINDENNDTFVKAVFIHKLFSIFNKIKK